MEQRSQNTMESGFVANTASRRTGGGVKRRTVLVGAAWSLPVVAAAVAAPLAAASVTPPKANYAQITAVANPKVGSNPTFRARGLFYDGTDYNDGTLEAGALFTITFSPGTTASSISNLVGVTYVSGDPTTGGPVIYQVTTDTTGEISLRLTNVQPAGGTISASMLTGSGTSTIIP